MQYKGSELNPLFYGEISSTHLFYDIFDKHHETAKAFVEYFFKVKAENLRLYGTGTRGFSVKLEVLDKGEISLCTLYRNKTIEFSIKR